MPASTAMLTPEHLSLQWDTTGCPPCIHHHTPAHTHTHTHTHTQHTTHIETAGYHPYAMPPQRKTCSKHRGWRLLPQTLLPFSSHVLTENSPSHHRAGPCCLKGSSLWTMGLVLSLTRRARVRGLSTSATHRRSPNQPKDAFPAGAYLHTESLQCVFCAHCASPLPPPPASPWMHAITLVCLHPRPN